MGEVITIGLDIAKSVFQAHGVDEAGAVVIRKRVSRAKLLLEFFASLQSCWSVSKPVPRPSLGSRAAGTWSYGEARHTSSIRKGHKSHLSPDQYPT